LKKQLSRRRRRKDVGGDAVACCAGTTQPADALLHARGIPGHVQVHNDGGALHIHALAQHIGRKQQVDARMVWYDRASAELCEDLSSADRTARHTTAAMREHRDSRRRRQLSIEHRDGLREMREGDNPLAGVPPHDRQQFIGSAAVHVRTGFQPREQRAYGVVVRAHLVEQRFAPGIRSKRELGESELLHTVREPPHRQVSPGEALPADKRIVHGASHRHPPNERRHERCAARGPLPGQ
jgi:hypothetical protein